jgi:hypothetical protein
VEGPCIRDFYILFASELSQYPKHV